MTDVKKKTPLFYFFYELADQLNVTKRDQRKLAIFFTQSAGIIERI